MVIWWSSYEDVMMMMTVLLILLTPLCPGGGRPQPWRARPWHLRGSTACQLTGIVLYCTANCRENRHQKLYCTANWRENGHQKLYCSVPTVEKISPKNSTVTSHCRENRPQKLRGTLPLPVPKESPKHVPNDVLKHVTANYSVLLWKNFERKQNLLKVRGRSIIANKLKIQTKESLQSQKFWESLKR